MRKFSICFWVGVCIFFGVAIMAHAQQADSISLRTKTFADVRYLKSVYKTDAAIEKLTSLEKSEVFDEELLSELADCYFQMGKYSEAAHLYDSLSFCAPGNIVYKIRKMQLNFRMKQFIDCISVAHDILAQDSIPAIISYTGDAFQKMEQGDSALWYYRRSLVYRPDNEAVVSKAMGILMEDEDFDGAISIADSFLARNPDNTVIAPLQGLAFYRKNDYESAIEAFQRQEDLGNDVYPIHYYLGQSYWHTEQLDKAERELLCAWQMDSSKVDLAYSIAAVKAEGFLSFEEEVQPWLERVYEMLLPDPSMMSRMYQQYASCYYRRGVWDKAIENYKEAYRYNPKFTAALSAIGYSYQVKKDYKRAVEWFEKYLAVADPSSAYYSSIKENLDFLKSEAFMEEPE